MENFSTISEMFLAVTDNFAESEKAAFSRKVSGKYVDIGYKEIRTQVEAFAHSLRSLGVARGDRVGIMSENRLEFVIADFACVCCGFVDVPVFTTLTSKQIEYIFTNAEVRAVVCSNRLQLGKLLKVAENIPTLSHIIVMQEDAFDSATGSSRVPIHSFSQMTLEGEKLRSTSPGLVRQLAMESQPDDLLTLIYTSGTTGNPKGVMLTHRNIVSNITGALRRLRISPDDIVLSYLPLCHSFERTGGYYTCFASGVLIAFAESLETVSANLAEVRPTLMTSVPRGLERIKQRAEKKFAAEPEKRRRVIQWAFEVGKKRYQVFEKGKIPGMILRWKYSVAERLVFNKVRAATGGRLRFFVSGGAALTRDVGEFFMALNIPIIEGYGLTESSPIITANPLEHPKLGTVGPPLDNVEVKIADDGEILTRGPHVMRGYFKDPDATSEAIDGDGWLHTGDIGIFDKEGYLKITDRKKHLIVSSGGKNIAPGPIEDLLSQSRFIDQILLIGDQLPFITALIVPNAEALAEAAGESGVAIETHGQLLLEFLTGPTAEAIIDGELRGMQRDLSAFERVRKFVLLAEPFSVENGMMTPTLKIKRKAAIERYKFEIGQMYAGAESE